MLYRYCLSLLMAKALLRSHKLYLASFFKKICLRRFRSPEKVCLTRLFPRYSQDSCIPFRIDLLLPLPHLSHLPFLFLVVLGFELRALH
jgi:hypothetical protein